MTSPRTSFLRNEINRNSAIVKALHSIIQTNNAQVTERNNCTNRFQPNIYLYGHLCAGIFNKALWSEKYVTI